MKTVSEEMVLERAPATRSRARTVAQPPCGNCATRSLCMLGPTEGQPLQALQFQVRERSFRRGDVLMQERTRPESVLVIKVGAVFGQRTGLDGEVRPVGL